MADFKDGMTISDPEHYHRQGRWQRADGLWYYMGSRGNYDTVVDFSSGISFEDRHIQSCLDKGYVVMVEPETQTAPAKHYKSTSGYVMPDAIDTFRLLSNQDVKVVVRSGGQYYLKDSVAKQFMKDMGL